MSDLSVVVGQLIRNGRHNKKITSRILGFNLRIDRSYMGRIERGEVNITVEKLYEIATALEMDAKNLLP